MRLKLVYALCCCTFLAQTLAPWKWMFLTLPFWGPNKMSNNDLLHQTYFSFLPLMADFHFLFVRWSFALECSLQCLLFRSLRRGFIHSLDVWNSWKVLVKNWLSVVIHNNIISWTEWEIVICMELPGILLSPFSKRKHIKESCFATKYFEAGRFFSFQVVIGYNSSNRGLCF